MSDYRDPEIQADARDDEFGPSSRADFLRTGARIATGELLDALRNRLAYLDRKEFVSGTDVIRDIQEWADAHEAASKQWSRIA